MQVPTRKRVVPDFHKRRLFGAASSAGTYEVTAKQAGFHNAVRSNIPLLVDQTARVDINAYGR